MTYYCHGMSNIGCRNQDKYKIAGCLQEGEKHYVGSPAHGDYTCGPHLLLDSTTRTIGFKNSADILAKSDNLIFENDLLMFSHILGKDRRNTMLNTVD